MTLDTSGWSGEGEFTAALIETLGKVSGIDFVRVEDAPAGRSDSGFSFLSNEVYVRFAAAQPRSRVRRTLQSALSGRTAAKDGMSLADLARALEAAAGIGAADYEDEGMLQYLRTERIVPPYQTRGYKVIELVRVYEVGPSA